MRKAINHLKKSDPVLAAIIEKIGPWKMQFGEPTFHSLVASGAYFRNPAFISSNQSSTTLIWVPIPFFSASRVTSNRPSRARS
jgi:hypothetical protein